MTRILKLILVLFCFLIFGIGSGLIAFIIFPILDILKFPKQKYLNIIHLTWKFFVKFLEDLKIIKVNFNFETNIKGKILVASHPSFIDIIILIGLFKNSTCFAKKEVLKNPLFRNIVEHIYIVNNLDIDEMVQKVSTYLDNDYNIIIFPTGTRTLPNEQIKIHKGAALLSLRTQKEIIPIKIDISHPFLSKNTSICKIPEETVIYDLQKISPINPKDYLNLPEIKARKRISEKIKEVL